jgi:hypothetical protein
MSDFTITFYVIIIYIINAVGYILQREALD